MIKQLPGRRASFRQLRRHSLERKASRFSDVSTRWNGPLLRTARWASRRADTVRASAMKSFGLLGRIAVQACIEAY